MIDLQFAAPDMSHLDGLRCEALVISFFGDERPLRGAGGLVDWRMCGFLSRRMQEGFISGEFGELTLMSGQGRLAVDKLLLVGLGTPGQLDGGRCQQALARTLEALALMCVRSSAVVLPGRSTGVIAPDTALEALVAAAAGPDQPHGLDELVIVDGVDAQRAMTPIVDRERRKERAQHYG